MNFIQVTPCLIVENLEPAISFFTETLGFKTIIHADIYAYVTRETVAFRIMQHKGVTPGNRKFAYYIDVRDVDSLCAELRPKLDALPKGDVEGPTNQKYGQRELTVVAPDGNLIVFGQEIKKNS